MKTKTRTDQPGTLPDKPSQLIRVAINDMKKILRANKHARLMKKRAPYQIDMDVWHLAHGVDGNRACAVCFAGSVMAGTLAAPDHATVGPSSFDDPIEDKLEALNCFRQGDVKGGLEYLGVSFLVAPTIQIKVARRVLDRPRAGTNDAAVGDFHALFDPFHRDVGKKNPFDQPATVRKFLGLMNKTARALEQEGY